MAKPQEGRPGARKHEVGAFVALSDIEPGWYTIGCRPLEDGRNLPRSTFVFAGLDWPYEAFDENPTVVGDTIRYDRRRMGKRIYLVQEHIDAIRAAVGRKVVRPRGGRGRAAILLKDKSGFKAMKGDVPLEKYLYARVDVEPSPVEEESFPAGARSLV